MDSPQTYPMPDRIRLGQGACFYDDTTGEYLLTGSGEANAWDMSEALRVEIVRRWNLHKLMSAALNETTALADSLRKTNENLLVACKRFTEQSVDDAGISELRFAWEQARAAIGRTEKAAGDVR